MLAQPISSESKVWLIHVRISSDRSNMMYDLHSHDRQVEEAA